MAGIRGAMVILALKFRKNITVKKRSGPDCERNDGIFSPWALSGAFLVEILFNAYALSAP